MTLFYFLMLTFVALVAFAGYDATNEISSFHRSPDPLCRNKSSNEVDGAET